MPDDEKIFEMLRNAGEKIVELEKKLKNTISKEAFNLLYNRIEKLETKIQLILAENKVIYTYINRAEMIVKTYKKVWDNHYKKHKKRKKELSELKKDIKILKIRTPVSGTIDELKEVLREKIPQLIDLIRNRHSAIMHNDNIWFSDGIYTTELAKIRNSIQKQLYTLNGGETSGGTKDTIVNDVVQEQHSKPPKLCKHNVNHLKCKICNVIIEKPPKYVRKDIKGFRLNDPITLVDPKFPVPEEKPPFICNKCGSKVYLPGVGELKGKYMCANCNNWQEKEKTWADYGFKKDHQEVTDITEKPPKCDFEGKNNVCNNKTIAHKKCFGYDNCVDYQHIVADSLKEDNPPEQDVYITTPICQEKETIVEKADLERWKGYLDDVSWNHDMIEEIEKIREDLWKYLTEEAEKKE